MSDESPQENRSWLPEILVGLGGLVILMLIIGLFFVSINLDAILPTRVPLTATPVAPSAVPGATAVGGPRGKIAFISNGAQGATLYVVEPDGSHLTTLASLPAAAAGLGWSPDGSLLTYAASSDIYVIQAAGGSPHNLTNSPSAMDDMPVWSPGPELRLAFTSNPAGPSRIYVVSADGVSLSAVTGGGGTPYDQQPSWSPDGSQIVYSSIVSQGAHLYVVNADGTGRTPLTGSTSSVDAQANEDNPAWSPDPGGSGPLIAFVAGEGSGRSLCVIRPDGSGRRCLTGDDMLVQRPVWSPDGTRIAFSANRSSNSDIYVIGADGSGLVRVTTDPGYDDYPVWSPDGTQIAYLASQGLVMQLAVINADGSGLLLFPPAATSNMPPAWGK